MPVTVILVDLRGVLAELIEFLCVASLVTEVVVPLAGRGGGRQRRTGGLRLRRRSPSPRLTGIREAARQMMMPHGGIGFTWEHDAHLFYRNAVGDSVLLGDPSFQRHRLARLLAL